MKTLCPLLLVSSALFGGTRLKELASLEGVRDNQLMGYGLVVGLSGTGDKDQTVFSTQTLTNILQRMGVAINPTAILVRNMASVMVTATLPPFAQPGTRIDITAAAIGDSSNLQGGMLLLTPLKAANGQTYAVAQGNLLTGGLHRRPRRQHANRESPDSRPYSRRRHRRASAAIAASRSKTQAAIAPGRFHDGGPRCRGCEQTLLPGRATARRTRKTRRWSPWSLPAAYTSRPVEFVAEMESLTVEADSSRKNRHQREDRNHRARQGCEDLAGRDSPRGFERGSAHRGGGSQPEPLAQQGATAIVPQTTVNTKEEKAKSVVLEKDATVEQLVRALQAIGSTPRDIIAILENMRTAGALDAEIEVI